MHASFCWSGSWILELKKKRRRRKKAEKIVCNDDANRSIDKVLVGINHRSLLTGSNRFYLFLPLPRSKFLPIDTNFLPPSICLRRGRDKRESKMERGHKYRSGVTRKMGARWESGPLQPWEQLVVAVSPYNPETRNRAFGPALRNQYPSTEKRISVQRNSRDKRNLA